MLYDIECQCNMWMKNWERVYGICRGLFMALSQHMPIAIEGTTTFGQDTWSAAPVGHLPWNMELLWARYLTARCVASESTTGQHNSTQWTLGILPWSLQFETRSRRTCHDNHMIALEAWMFAFPPCFRWAARSPTQRVILTVSKIHNFGITEILAGKRPGEQTPYANYLQ
jgi:hypothetical protein